MINLIYCILVIKIKKMVTLLLSGCQRDYLVGGHNAIRSVCFNNWYSLFLWLFLVCSNTPEIKSFLWLNFFLSEVFNDIFNVSSHKIKESKFGEFFIRVATPLLVTESTQKMT